MIKPAYRCRGSQPAPGWPWLALSSTVLAILTGLGFHQACRLAADTYARPSFYLPRMLLPIASALVGAFAVCGIAFAVVALRGRSGGRPLAWLVLVVHALLLIGIAVVNRLANHAPF